MKPLNIMEHCSLAVSLTYLRGLEVSELEEEVMLKLIILLVF